MKHGQVLNIDETIKAIRTALENCYASNPDLEINEVYVGIAGHHIKSLQTRGDIVRQDTDDEISQREIDQLISDQYKTYIPAGDQIIDVIPQEFTVDNFQNIPDPIGYGGVKVGANFHIITGDKNAIRNINRCRGKRGLKNKDLVLQPLASAAAVMANRKTWKQAWPLLILAVVPPTWPFFMKDFKAYGRDSIWRGKYHQRYQNRSGCSENTGRANESAVWQCPCQ